MSNPNFFELGGVSVPYEAGFGINQTYGTVQASTWPPIRMSDGSAKVQSSWGGKIKTTITGKGFLPAAWCGLDFTQPMLLKCAGGLGIGSAVNAISIPNARRTEDFYLPHGYAIVNGKKVESSVSMAGDTATVTPVVNATAYGVIYYPQITVFAKPVESNADLGRATYGWTLEAEEV